jgi:hypothetical protein
MVIVVVRMRERIVGVGAMMVVGMAESIPVAMAIPAQMFV